MTQVPVGNLPAEVTSFVGRRRELLVAKRLLPGTRLLTLVGAGGVGKSRLARRVAADAHRAFPDGVWLVELAAVQQGEVVAYSVARVLGLPEESPDPVAQLASHLREKKLLLVLDNCEQVLGATAELITRLLAAGAEVRVLATSRQVLGVAGEQLLPVQPLSLPLTDEPSSVGQSEAVSLFVERATAVVPEFTVGPENRALVSVLCRRLDGIPLALELAAVRLRAMPLREIAERIDDALRFLVVGDRTAPLRQQTLRSTIAWSYDLCSEAERQLWQQLSVFAGGFTLDAAEAVCAEGMVGGDVVDVLAALVDKSIVTRPAVQHDADRFTMLEVLRQYGGVKLVEAGNGRATRRRHRDYFMKLAQRGALDYVSPRDAMWFNAVGHELPNLRRSLKYSLTQPGESQAALDIAAHLRPYWSHTGYLGEGFRWLERALDLDPTPTHARARAVSAAAFLAVLLSDADAAESLLDEGATLADELGDLEVAADLAVAAALLQQTTANLPRGMELARIARERSQAAASPVSINEALFVAATISFELDDEKALELAAEYLATAERAGAQLLTACAHWISGLVILRVGDRDSAREHLYEAIKFFARFGRPNLTAMGLEALASVAVADRDHDRAARLMGAAHNIWQASYVPATRQISARMTADARIQALKALGEDTFYAAFEQGAALTFDEGIRYASGRAGADEDHVCPPVEPPAPAGLTRRERQLAELVASGLSNRDIASRLVISRRTVESHIEHILNKLGFRSRTQIAAWVGQQHEGSLGKR